LIIVPNKERWGVVRSTRQKRAILEELSRTRSHPTAAELYATVRRRLPRVSLGTVYRVLQGLAADSAVLRLDSGGAAARFDADTSEHHHVRCARCGSVADLPPGRVPNLLARFRAKTDYALEGVRIELIGVCPRCQVQRRST
jgi:Fur family transcriptional regulator, ferric uptake regulator